MTILVRLAALSACTAVVTFSFPVAADYGGPSGYGASETTYEIEVSHTGYPNGDREAGSEAPEAGDAPSYIVLEVQDGVTEEVDGETVIVVQEPDPVAATEVAPPPPRTAPADQPSVSCPSGGIWVNGYWSYADGQYIWVDGHCVVQRVDYVFVHPRWDYYANVWWFVPGYYRPCSVWVGFGYYRPWYWFPPYHHAYYRGYRGVPVHRGVPRRATVAHPVRHSPSFRYTDTVTRKPLRTSTVTRAPGLGRTSTVQRAPGPSRTSTVARSSGPSRTSTVTRAPPTRTSAVTRVPPTRTSAVTRVPPTRTSPIVRSTPTSTRVGAVNRPGSVVGQPRAKPTRTAGVDRGTSGPSRTSSVRRSGFGSSRSGTVSRPSSRTSRTGPARSPSFGSGRSGSIFGGRSGMGSSRPSFGGRGGFSGGSGGGRSVPTARGR